MKKGVVKKGISNKVDEIKKVVKGDYIHKIIFIARIVISLAIGFLPSFIFITLFIQYGSPFSNYAKFLLNFSSSWGAWISAIFISLIINASVKILKSKEKIRKIFENKILLIVSLLVIFIFVVLILVQLYLYLNFNLRNDILIRLSSDEDNLFFTNNPSENVALKISVVMNPFCSAQCNYKFEDVSNGKIIEAGELNITSVLSKTKNYTIENERLVRGSQTLRRFEISCVAKKTWFCYTSGLESKRAVLLTVNYDLTEEELEFQNYSREEIINVWKNIFLTEVLLNQSKQNINFINNSFSNNFSSLLANLTIEYPLINDAFVGLETSWKMQGFDSLRISLSEVTDKVADFKNKTEQFNDRILNNISLYNNLIENLSVSRKRLNEIYQAMPSVQNCEELNRLVINFNNILDYFETQSSLSEREMVVLNLWDEINELYHLVKMTSETNACILKNNIDEVTFVKISIAPPITSIPERTLENPIPLCCFEEKCQKCCEKECAEENYPIIFLHGQSINKALPTDYSLDSFTFFKGKIISEGYIDAGAMVISPISEPDGLWGKVNASVVMTGSYFFDTYKTTDGEQTVSSNVDNIDTYAIRLRKLIDLVKYRTNKNKVILVTHSMGGVVARRYVQVFGNNSVDKMILITAPNHGIGDKIGDYCAVIGPEASCNDLKRDSIFMNELNNARTDFVETHNIIGTGCDMGDDTGDGFIKSSSQYLASAINYYFEGTCDELNFNFFHEAIIIPNKYPDVYERIKNILKN